MQQTNDYWDKRALRRLTDSEKISEQHIRRIKKIYERAFKNIDRDIKNIYQNYYKVANTGERKIDIQKLKELLTRSETKKTWDQLKRQGLDKYVMNNYKARISRLEQLQAQIYAKAKTIYPKEELEQTMAYKGVINDSYYKAIYDTQIGTGYDFSFSMLDKNLVNAVLNEKWSDKNYSQRIWTNTDILADSISEIIGGSLLSGQGLEKTEKQIRERFNVGKHYAERLVRTETNYFHNKADAMAYEEMGVKYYIFVAVLDSRTSEICQSMDGTKHKYSEMQVGENYPPMHVNCRSKTRGFISSEVEKMLKRRATTPFEDTPELIKNISYKEWAKKYNDTTLKINKNGVWSFNSVKYNGIRENFKKAFSFIDFKNNKNKIIYENVDKLKVKVVGSLKAQYDKFTNTAYLPEIVSARNGVTTIHEIAHALDYTIGKKLGLEQLSTSAKLTELIDKYYENNGGQLPEKIIKYIDDIKNKVSKKTGALIPVDIMHEKNKLEYVDYKYDMPNRFCDMFSALSKGKANRHLFALHPQWYYEKAGYREAELLAQFTCLKMTNSKKELNLLKSVAPDIYKELNKLYNRISKEIGRL